MRIDVQGFIGDELADAVWRLYNEAFDELRTSAVQRHMMTRDEFDEVIRDPRILKYLALDPEQDDRPCALSTLTNQLDAIPLISPDYFQRRWAAHFAAGRIWYIGLLGLHPDCRGTGLFERLIEEMYRVIAAGNGVAAFDICRRNEEVYRFPEAIRAALEPYAGTVLSHQLDEQTYWLYEFPAAS
jgi:GNAT superfamily N-acetyltransferase